eukprot:bmy_15754T0
MRKLNNRCLQTVKLIKAINLLGCFREYSARKALHSRGHSVFQPMPINNGNETKRYNHCHEETSHVCSPGNVHRATKDLKPRISLGEEVGHLARIGGGWGFGLEKVWNTTVRNEKASRTTERRGEAVKGRKPNCAMGSTQIYSLDEHY